MKDWGEIFRVCKEAGLVFQYQILGEILEVKRGDRKQLYGCPSCRCQTVKPLEKG